MSSEYTVLSTIITIIALFLYFSWFVSSLRFNNQKLKMKSSNERYEEKSFLKSLVDPDMGSKSIAFFLILIILFLVFINKYFIKLEPTKPEPPVTTIIFFM